MKLFIVLHHTADPSQGPQLSKVDVLHRNRGFHKGTLGYYVGYHFFIGVDGTVVQTRSEHEPGWHSSGYICDVNNPVAEQLCRDEKVSWRDKIINNVCIGICLAGDFTRHTPNHVQIEALEELAWKLQTRWPIPDSAILLHRECKRTACPGTDLRALLLEKRKDRTRKKIEQLKKAQKRATGRRLLLIQRILSRLLS